MEDKEDSFLKTRRFGKIIYSPQQGNIRLKNSLETINLTPIENKILDALSSPEEMIFDEESKKQYKFTSNFALSKSLLAGTEESATYGMLAHIRVSISRLRKKLGDNCDIIAVKGHGYKFFPNTTSIKPSSEER